MARFESEFGNKAGIIAAALAAILFVLAYLAVAPTKHFPSTKIFEIRQGDNLRKIAAGLAEKGYIRSRSLFEFAVIVAGDSKNLRFGDYFFERPLSLIEIAKRIGEGIFGIESVKVTIPEGANLYEVSSLFESLGMFTKKELFTFTGRPGLEHATSTNTTLPPDFSSKADLLLQKPRSASLEGYLFPDTYFFLKNDTPEKVIEKMLGNLERKITPELRQEVERQGRTIHEVLTLASILEEEAHRGEDRKIIAGILWKRLKKGMLLQVDATLTYVTGRASLSLTDADLAKKSPYNTYRHKGLPLGPISNPGLDSINAALHPEETPYWFYLSDRAGKIYYAKTHEGHIANKRKYLSGK